MRSSSRKITTTITKILWNNVSSRGIELFIMVEQLILIGWYKPIDYYFSTNDSFQSDGMFIYVDGCLFCNEGKKRWWEFK